MILLTRTVLIVSDFTLAVVITTMNFQDGGMQKNPLFLNFLVVLALAVCIVRHINYYKITKKIY